VKNQAKALGRTAFAYPYLNNKSKPGGNAIFDAFRFWWAPGCPAAEDPDI
jgi:hypothetical protein